MSTLFTLLLLASLVFLVVGFFNPRRSLFWDKKERTKKKSALIYGGLTVLFFILFGVTTDTKSEAKSNDEAQAVQKTAVSNPSKAEKTIDMPAEQKLAILDAGTFVDTTNIKVIRMKTLLDELASNYNQPRDTIADYTSRAQGVLHDKGIDESCLDILEEMHKAGKIDNTPYRDAITLYVMLRAKE